MEYRQFDHSYVVRVDPGEEVVASLRTLCDTENIRLAEITGIGAVNLVEIGVFNVNTKEYNTRVYEGMYEITSLVGNATRKDGEVYLHLHINFGDPEGNARGGHLVRTVVSATSEIIVRAIDGEVGRRMSEEIGLNLLQF